MTSLSELKNALVAVCENTYHFTAGSDHLRKYIVWSEDGSGDTVFANGELQEQVITGTVDLFTDDPEDLTLFNGVQNALNGLCAWWLTSIQYEDDTGLTHYEWRWEVA